VEHKKQIGENMCGIVGHLGPEKAVETVLEGLKRLEYRGYDSSGVSFVDNNSNKLNLYKKSGKIENLCNALENVDTHSMLAIGHTRWATHGVVNDENAHPHQNGSISIVHNGIIENAAELKKEVPSYNFLSQTDTEVFLALITTYKKDLSTKDAVLKAYSKVKGHSAFVVLCSETREIFAIRSGAPLVCGTSAGDSRALVSSDPYALIGVCDRIYFPENEVLCHLSSANKDLLAFYELNGEVSQRYESKVQEATLDSVEKGGHEHYMLKEIHEQPGLVRSLCQYYFGGDGQNTLQEMSKLKASKFHIVACGTAYYAGLVVRDFLESITKIPCTMEFGSEFRYRKPILNKEAGDVALFISQSGETADTLASQELCKQNGIKTYSLVNVEGSTLFRECDSNLLIRAGIEIGVASTKAFTQMGLTGRLLALALSTDFENENSRVALENKFDLLANRIDELLLRADHIKNVAEEIYNKKGFFYTGRYTYFPIALEGALKLKEIAYVHAEGYASGELKHGPLALIDENMVNIAIVGPELYEKTVSNIQEIKARKGIIVSIGDKDDDSLEELSDYYIPLYLEGLDELAPLYINVVNQLLAYYMAKFMGTDIDKPRNLAKSVTVE
jgi:glucosamine--fructose-6-phosphate aminotransferase (isomerizing)